MRSAEVPLPPPDRAAPAAAPSTNIPSREKLVLLPPPSARLVRPCAVRVPVPKTSRSQMLAVAPLLRRCRATLVVARCPTTTLNMPKAGMFRTVRYLEPHLLCVI